MGYQSDVALAIRKNYETKMLADPNIAQLLSEATGFVKEDGLLFYWGWCKWCEVDDNVDALMGFLGNLLDDKYEDFLFIRVGEDRGDEDIQGGWYDNPFNMGYIREITFTDPTSGENY